uniref:Non-specific lipid-transfer protein n=1 Tax=Kalanchoe fedtschenkoi TaxID=63787 RepID=A0A7N0VC82_KALFE
MATSTATFLKAASVALLICMVAFEPPLAARAAISCGTVASALSPCIPYLKAGPPAAPAARCCGGIKSLLLAAKTTADRQAACSCLKSQAGQVPNLKPAAASALPKACGVSIPYPISPSTNCANVK